MPIIATANGTGQTFEPAPVGVHQAVCVDVVDLGMLDVSWQGVKKTQHKVNIAWQIDELRDDGKPYLIFKRYTLSLHEKSGLRKDLESWLGRKFTRDDEMGFDLESMLGSNCLLNVIHNHVGDRVYANVANVSPVMKNMKPIHARDFVRKCERVTEAPSQVTPPRHDDGDEPPPLTDDDFGVPF